MGMAIEVEMIEAREWREREREPPSTGSLPQLFLMAKAGSVQGQGARSPMWAAQTQPSELPPAAS